jgi:hypothetical protein
MGLCAKPLELAGNYCLDLNIILPLGVAKAAHIHSLNRGKLFQVLLGKPADDSVLWSTKFQQHKIQFMHHTCVIYMCFIILNK